MIEEKKIVDATSDLPAEETATPEPIEPLEPVKSTAELSEEVWNIRKPKVPANPGQIRFA